MRPKEEYEEAHIPVQLFGK
ncbi:hypothetical protein [Ectobacillus panaciterrae]